LLAVRPDPVHDLDVFQNATNVYVTFSSPKNGKTVKYNVSAECGEDGLHEVIVLITGTLLSRPATADYTDVDAGTLLLFSKHMSEQR